MKMPTLALVFVSTAGSYLALAQQTVPFNNGIPIAPLGLAGRSLPNGPVEYDTAVASGNPRYGVTVDLNDTGMGFVAYERFHPGDVLRFVVRGAGEVVKCKGEIRTVADLTRGQVADGFRYGVQFQNLTAPQVDALNRICLHYGVPRMYTEFDTRRGGLLGGLQKRMERGMAQRRREFRNRYRVCKC